MEISKYDNQVTILYKVADYFQVPVRYILTTPGEETLTGLVIKGIIYEPIISLFPQSLEEIYPLVENKISRRELAYLYNFYATERDIPAFETIQEFLRENGFQRPTDLNVMYEDWIIKYRRELEKDKDILERIQIIQEGFETITHPLTSTELVIDHVTLEAKAPQRDGILVFNQAVVSYFIPYLQYNEGKDEKGDAIKSYYKIYRGESVVSSEARPGIIPKLDLIVQDKYDGENIYASLWTLGLEKALIKPIQKGYTLLTYNLDKQLLTFRVSEEHPKTRREVLTHIQKTFGFPLEEITEISISGNFTVFVEEPVIEYILFHLILNDPTFTAYLYIDEHITPAPEKTRLTIHYRGLTEEGAATAYLLNTVVEGKHSLSVKISQAVSRDSAEEFRRILTLLMSIYRERKNEIVELYSFIPPPPPEVKPSKTVTVKTRPIAVVKQLEAAAPDVFPKGYARICQGKNQPIIITPDQVNEWEERKIVDSITKTLINRQILPFPAPPDDKFLLVCPSDDAPFPGIRTNTLANKDKYPYLPCCYRSNHVESSASLYSTYYKGASKKVKGSKKRTKIKGEKFLPPGGEGEIPVPMENLLTHIRENIWKRYGVIRDPNSLIHSILTALNYENYNNLQEKDKIILAEEVRNSLVGYAEIMKQELYDFSVEEIETQILSPDLFFDPALYYRSLEEFFDINIYTFSSGKGPEEEGEPIGKLEIPRSKYFHARSLRLRESVLIYKHWGSKAYKPTYPQCEVIINIKGRERTKIFEEDVTEFIHTTLLETHPITTWYIYNEGIYSVINLYSNNYLLEGAVAQILDDYGKMRGLVFPEITYFFPPSQPENLPVVEEMTIAISETAIEYFGEPIAATFSGGKTTGLWFTWKTEYLYGIFVPIQETEEYSSLPKGPSPPIEFIESVQTSARIALLEKQISLLIQVIQWLYLLSSLTPREFIRKYGYINKTPVEDSAQFYDFSDLPPELPQGDISQVITKLEERVPTFFHNGKIVFYSPEFAGKMEGYLETFSRQHRGMTGFLEPSVVLPTHLEGYFTREEDFIQEPHTVILIGKENFETWISSVTRPSYNGIIIVSKLDSDLSLRREPYIYNGEETYIVQNVLDGSLSRALNVGRNWRDELVNPGYLSEPWEEKEYYLVYEISPASVLQVKEDLSHRRPPLEVLIYPNDTYAALLKI